jgi:pterin-4a-carbinolamine dehydratase
MKLIVNEKECAQQVRQAPRELILKSSLNSILAEKLQNTLALGPLIEANLNNQNLLILQKPWTLGHSANGDHLEATYAWKHWKMGIKVLSALLNLQEDSDHHSDFTLKQDLLDLKLCTHEPKWGISYKDIAFAEAFHKILTVIVNTP